MGAILSGGVAYLGNSLGRRVGRRKMTIFGLRPKYTSNIITVASGSLIFLVTMGLAAAFSSEVQIFLSGIDVLQRQIVQLQHQSEELNAKINEDTLKISAGQILEAFQPLSVDIIECGRPEKKIREHLDTLLGLANQNALLRNNLAAERIHKQPFPEDTRLVGYVIPEKTKLIEQLSKARGTVVCQVISGSKPTFFGERIVGHFLLTPNPRIYRKGEVITRTRINGAQPFEQVQSDVQTFVYGDLKFKVTRAGMIRSPVNDRLVTSIDQSEIKDKALKISRAGKAVGLKVIANSDIYPLGPLEASLVVEAP